MTEGLVSWSALSDIDPGQVGGLVVEYASRARTATYESSDERAMATVAAIHQALLAADQGEQPTEPAFTLPEWLTEAIAWRLSEPLRVPVADAISIRALERFGLHELRPTVDHQIAMLDLPVDWSDLPDEQLRISRVRAGQLVERLLDLEATWDNTTFSTRSQPSLVAAVASHSASRRALIAAAVAGLEDTHSKNEAKWMTALVAALAPSDDEWRPHVSLLLALAHSGDDRRIVRVARAALERLDVDLPQRDWLGGIVRGLRHALHREPTPGEYARARIDPEILGGLLVEHGRRADAGHYSEPWEQTAARHAAIDAAIEAAIRGREPAEPTTSIPGWIRTTIGDLVGDRNRRIEGRDFARLRVVERSGLLKLAVDEDYVAAMVNGFSEGWKWESPARMDIVEWFTGDPELVERALWRIFDLTGTGRANLTLADSIALRFRGNNSWHGACIELCESGVLPRPRLLDACLATLAKDWPPVRLRWFSGLLAELSPTPAEIDGRQTAYRKLLSSAATPVITVGLDALEGIDKRGKLDDDATLTMLAPVLASAPKTQALRALRLLDAIRHRSTDDRPLRLLLGALAHPHRDVQQAAGKRLIAAAEHEPLLRLADEFELDPVVRRALGLPLTPAGPGVEPAPAIDLPALRPVGELDLLDRFAALLERPDDPIELELILDRLAQTSDALVLAPLAGRAKTILKRGDTFWDGDTTLAGHLAALVVAAGGSGTKVKLPKDPIERFLALRMREVEQILVGARPPRGLAATPDDPAGWVSADALVKRLRNDELSRPADVVAALLRLSSDGRTEALAGVRGDREIDAVVRHALGANPDPEQRIGNPDLWVAASRARSPLSDDPLLIACGLDHDGQGRPLNPSFTRLVDINAGRTAEINFRGQAIPLDLYGTAWTIPLSLMHPLQRPSDLQPTALGGPANDLVDLNTPWTSWTASVWPHDADHFLLHRIGDFVSRVGWSAPRPTYLLPALLRHPGRLGPLSALAVAVGLSSGNAEERVLAADLLIDVTTRGRMTSTAIAEAMAFAIEPCIATRWASSLTIAAEGGASTAVVEILTALLPHVPTSKTGLHALLDLVHAEQLRLGRPVNDPVLRDWLVTIRGSSKSARTARAILSL